MAVSTERRRRVGLPSTIGQRLAVLRIALLAALVVPTQESHRLERLPEMALTAQGRVIESAPGSLVIEYRAADMHTESTLEVEHIGFELDESDGFVYFIEQDEELPLAEGLRRLRPGAWIEVAPMPQREFTRWRVQGRQSSATNQQPGSVDRLLRPQTQAETFGIRGWTYIWVVAEYRG